MKRRERPKLLERAVTVETRNYVVAVLVAFVVIVLLPWWLRWCLLYIGATVFVASLVAPFVDDWRPKARVQPAGKAVFISGCDSGFGNSLAQRLDDLGLHVFAGCLFPDKEGAEKLKKSCSERLHVVPLDVTSEESVEKAMNYVKDNIRQNKFWAVVNNAGLNEGGEIIWTKVDTMLKVMNVNAYGVMRVTKAFLPLLCKDQGRVVTVASQAGRYTYPGMVSYCMSKQAAVAYCEGLRLEMYRFGVKVITIEPWMFKTPITNEERVLKYISESWDSSPDEVKNLFPEKYIEIYKKSSLKFLRWSISDRPEDVVQCMEEAVLAFDPKYTYNPGTLFSRLSHWFIQRLPKPIADGLLHDEFSADASWSE